MKCVEEVSYKTHDVQLQWKSFHPHQLKTDFQQINVIEIGSIDQKHAIPIY